MNAFGTAQGHARVEDARLLTGAGRYVDDIAPAGALWAVFLRSDVAAGRITALDVSAARAMPGVAAVLTAADLQAAGVTLGMRGRVQTNRDGRRGAAPERPILATDRVCHVGQPIACILAETRAQALDAAEAVVLDLDHGPVHLDLAPGGAPVHPEAPDNIAYDWDTGDAAATDAGIAAAAHVVRLTVRHNRVIVNPIEPRTAWALWDGARLHFAFAGQGVWNQKAELARHLGLPPDAVQVTTPDVGGGFGMKAMTYPEYPVIAAASRLLGRPVRWAAERTEGMLTDNAGRDLVAEVTLGLAADLAITAYRVDLISNLGAFNSQFGQAIQSDLFAKVLTGIYDIPAAHLRARGVYTHTVPVDAYRGAGRPEAILTLERTLDHAARVLGADPAALRRRNMIRSFPFRTLTGELIDTGDFPRILDRLLAEADLPGLAARRAAAAARGRVLG
ncbi:MAG: xanthine dehydrogenase family protein molybdopterin-binding subunit, partial [Rhodobacterales bacterium]|nr:xanthine dehydrogenase family protein molybdopterin-binding subunit [Rhodobacterales bacterium]